MNDYYMRIVKKCDSFLSDYEHSYFINHRVIHITCDKILPCEIIKSGFDAYKDNKYVKDLRTLRFFAKVKEFAIDKIAEINNF